MAGNRAQRMAAMKIGKVHLMIAIIASTIAALLFSGYMMCEIIKAAEVSVHTNYVYSNEMK